MTDIAALKAQLSSCTADHAELRRQAAILDELKSHVDLSSQRSLDMTRQASILDHLKAQLSMSNNLCVELMFTKTSLQEAQALKSQLHHLESAASGIKSVKCTHPASEQPVIYASHNSTCNSADIDTTNPVGAGSAKHTIHWSLMEKTVAYTAW